MYDMDFRIFKKVIYFDFNNVRLLILLFCIIYLFIFIRYVWLYGGIFDVYVVIMRGFYLVIVIFIIMEVFVLLVVVYYMCKVVRVC